MAWNSRALRRGGADADRPAGWFRPTVVVLVYVLVAGTWILLSGQAVDAVAGEDHDLYTALEVGKGLGFVAVTGVVLLILLRRYTARIESAHAEARRMARFAELSPNPVIEFGPDGSVASANAATRAATGSLGVSIERLLPPDAQDIARRCMATGEHVSGVLHTVAGRSWRWAFFPADPPVSAFCYGYDRTEETRLEVQVQQAARMESVGRLAAGVAHDLNNFLMAIGGFRELARMKLEENHPAQEELAGMRDQIEAARDLVKKLMLIARVRSSAENVTRVDLAGQFEALASTVRHLLPYHVEFEFNVPPGPCTVEVDVRELERALLNLASNAVDAMPSGGRLHLALERAPGGRIAIVVADTGEGIPQDVLPRIFDPFFTTKEEGKGTGLGLASVYSFATRSGGTVEVETHPGKGSKFRLLLPLASGGG